MAQGRAAPASVLCRGRGWGSRGREQDLCCAAECSHQSESCQTLAVGRDHRNTGYPHPNCGAARGGATGDLTRADGAVQASSEGRGNS